MKPAKKQASETAKVIAANLRAWRTGHRLTFRRAAEMYGTDASWIVRVESGKHDIGVATLEKLARVTGMSVAELVSHRPIPGHVIDQQQG